MTPLLAKMVILGVALGITGCTQTETVNGEAPCLDLTDSSAKASFEGILTVQIFAGPPNYESIAGGDAEERPFILELPSRLCAFDGEFIDKDETFDRVHVSSEDGAIFEVLKASVGREVEVKGKAFGSHTGHHHAPVVLMAEAVTVRPKAD